MTIRTRTILLVEDNPDDAALTFRALKRSHVANEVVLASTGLEALDYLFATGAWAGKDLRLPEVVLLDLRLPGIDGIEVLRRIRTSDRTRLVPVVVLTTSKEERDVIDSYKLGANSYIQKPVDFAHFLEAAEHLSLYWLVLNEAPPETTA